jgi:hypothetical protein
VRELIAQATDGITDPTTWVYGGSAIALISILVAAIIRVQRTYPRMYGEPIRLLEERLHERKEENDAQAVKIATLERGQRECDFVVAALIRALQKAGIEVPPEAFLRRRRSGDDRYGDGLFGEDG